MQGFSPDHKPCPSVPSRGSGWNGRTQRKRTNVSHLLREVIEAYLKYMDQAFMHPGERDIMAKLQKMEDRLVRLNLKGLHATGRIMYLVAAAWKMGHRNEPLTEEVYEALMEKSKVVSSQWMENYPQKRAS